MRLVICSLALCSTLAHAEPYGDVSDVKRQVAVVTKVERRVQNSPNGGTVAVGALFGAAGTLLASTLSSKTTYLHEMRALSGETLVALSATEFGVGSCVVVASTRHEAVLERSDGCPAAVKAPDAAASASTAASAPQPQ